MNFTKQQISFLVRTRKKDLRQDLRQARVLKRNKKEKDEIKLTDRSNVLHYANDTHTTQVGIELTKIMKFCRVSHVATGRRDSRCPREKRDRNVQPVKRTRKGKTGMSRIIILNGVESRARSSFSRVAAKRGRGYFFLFSFAAQERSDRQTRIPRCVTIRNSLRVIFFFF